MLRFRRGLLRGDTFLFPTWERTRVPSESGKISEAVMSRCSTPHELRREREFDLMYNALSEEDPFKKAIDKGMNTLKGNMLGGIHIRKKQIPPYYRIKFGVYNLYVLPLDKERRLSYTLASCQTGVDVVILEAFPDHKSYAKRFGYRTR